MSHPRTRVGLLASTLLVLLAVGCQEGALAPADLATPDLAMSVDLSMPDLAGPSCGAIVTCIFGCGVSNLTCSQGCISGAQPAQIQAAGVLAICAATNCLSTADGGAGGLGNPLQLITCLGSKCSSEAAGCPGLFGASM
jgi:hypothetical protein